MRALTVKQPWAWAICHAGKDVENRGWPIPPKLLEDGPVRVALHAGKAMDLIGVDLWPDGRPVPFEHSGYTDDDCNVVSGDRFVMGIGDDGLWRRQSFGAIVAVIELTGSHRAGRYVDPDSPPDCLTTGCATDQTADDPHHSSPLARNPWAIEEVNVHHWQIGSVQVLDDPIPYRGSLGLWMVPDDIAAQVNEQTAQKETAK